MGGLSKLRCPVTGNVSSVSLGALGKRFWCAEMDLLKGVNCNNKKAIGKATPEADCPAAEKAKIHPQTHVNQTPNTTVEFYFM